MPTEVGLVAIRLKIILLAAGASRVCTRMSNMFTLSLCMQANHRHQLNQVQNRGLVLMCLVLPVVRTLRTAAPG